MTAERKREAREKFLLGGIVVRAGLTNADRAFLLGGFLELAKIAPGSLEYRRMRDIGEAAFKAPSPDAAEARTRETAEWH
ncbi:conjugal transfer protein TraD [Ensifer sp. BR816]|uniref:conjugal transfer protein TraD n=1 Tax=Rhizobium sp. (strain BR816) TaxID=1057002 RepID=UPI0003771217|nr:conjugal transfer protein TraD [Ensifer sp. BR816]